MSFKSAVRSDSFRMSSFHMPLANFIRTSVPLVIGLSVGAVGAVLFMGSMPGEEGSPEERAAKLEVELKKARNQLVALEADPRSRRDKPGRTLGDRVRGIGEDIRDGRPVTPEDIFRASQPLMRDLAPLFDRMRVKGEKHRIDQLSGEFARKYDLTAAQQEELRSWFERKSEENAKRWSDMVSRDGTRLVDVMKASQDYRMDEGLDPVMERMLTGGKLAEFKTTRMTERVERVQQDADARTQRLDNIVKLDDAQRDQVFGIMARNSRDYDPAMKLEGGVGQIGATPAGDARQAMLSVLRPDQRAAYEAEQQRRRQEARKDMEALGLSLPAEWDALDMEDFR
jgi:hypothetical protein